MLYYISELKKYVNILVFVSTSKLKDSDYKKIKYLADIIIERENVGYDFYSYKIGLKELTNISLDEIILCNDSVFGPLYDLGPLFNRMSREDSDFWGITESTAKSYHLQSYFLVFKNKIFSSSVFWDFWNKLEIINRREEVIEKYEIGLTQYLIKNNFKPEAFIKTIQRTSEQRIDNFKSLIGVFCNRLRSAPKKIFKAPLYIFSVTKGFISGDLFKDIDPTQNLWKETIIKHKMPFIKTNLLLNNPGKINISGWEKVLKKYTNYDIFLIKKHLLEQKKS
ncbi:MAG: hypothetical protein KA059_07570 [Elusimicrobiales bacterium]|nr:hypothetical protein [Elusimicrobiales bacterium]